MRHSQIENLRASSSNLIPSLEQLELQMKSLNGDSDFDKQLWHFARLLYTDAAFIKNFGGTTFMRLLSFDSIQKKLDKKNAELAKVRSLRKKLADREKIISLDIDNLQNQNINIPLTIQTRWRKSTIKKIFLLPTRTKKLNLTSAIISIPFPKALKLLRNSNEY